MEGQTMQERIGPATASPVQAETPDGRPGMAGPARAPMAVLMERLEQAAPFVSVKDPALKDRVGWLADEAAAAPAALDKPWFKTRVSYVVQDVERLNNTQLVMDPALRAELDKLALSSPGLRHEQLAALVRETAHLRPEDGPLAQDIRRLARSAVTGSVDVSSEEGRKQVEQLAEGVQEAKAGEPAPAPAPAPVATAADPTPSAAPAAKANPAAATPNPASAAAPVGPAAPGQSAVPGAVPACPQPGGPQPASAAAGQPTASDQPAPIANARAADAQGHTTVNAQQVQFRGTLRDILASARPPEPSTPPPWSNEPAPLTGRLGSYEERRADQSSNRLVTEARNAAQSAVRAVEALGAGPGSGVLSKIRQAAAGDPDGLAGVMTGMQPGGRYEQLRAEFNAAMTSERAFAASYDKAVSSAGQYATAREAVGADLARRGIDPVPVEGQFAAMDKAIGEGTAALPGRDAGKSMQQELAEKAAEFFRQLMERVKSAVSPEQKPGAAPAPAPSPGMTM